MATTSAQRKNKKKTQTSRSRGVSWVGPTKSGKGKITLSTVGTTNKKMVQTPYKTESGKRRILEIITTRRVIK